MGYIPDDIKMLTELFVKSGREIYMVGGCVRDMLMGKEPSDFDLATSAFPEETKKILKDFTVLETGLKHGTVTARINGASYEITTYRIESGYSDKRHPDSVDFTRNLSEDLSRRDFTINAMAMDCSGNVIDYFGGRDDIEKRIIRTVGNPDDRFREDALRILRAVRFSAKLGFETEEATARSIFSNKGLLKDISRERIFTEISKTVTAEFAPETIREFYPVIFEAIYESKNLGSKDSDGTLREKFAEVSEFFREIHGRAEGAEIRFAALFKIIGEEDAKATLRSLKVSNDFSRAVTKIISCSDELEEAHGDREEAFVDALVRYGEDCVTKAALLSDFCKNGKLTEVAEKDITLVEELKKKRCLSLKELAVSGADIQATGLDGRDIGDALKAILREVSHGRLENEKEEILDFVGNNIKKQQIDN